VIVDMGNDVTVSKVRLRSICDVICNFSLEILRDGVQLQDLAESSVTSRIATGDCLECICIDIFMCVSAQKHDIEKPCSILTSSFYLSHVCLCECL
jgi:hypothetical protein